MLLHAMHRGRSWSSKAKQLFGCFFNSIEISIRSVASWFGIAGASIRHVKQSHIYQNVRVPCFGFWKGVDNVHTNHLQRVSLSRGAWFFPWCVMTLAGTVWAKFTLLSDSQISLWYKPGQQNVHGLEQQSSLHQVQYCDLGSRLNWADLARNSRMRTRRGFRVYNGIPLEPRKFY